MIQSRYQQWRRHIFHLCFYTAFALTQSKNPPDCKFCQPEHVTVTLDPFVSLDDIDDRNRYEVKDALSLISVITSEFKRILIPYRHGSTSSLDIIPATVAIWNSRVATPQKLEAWIFFENPTYNNASYTELETLHRLVDNANKIHNKTITGIIIPAVSARYLSNKVYAVIKNAEGIFQNYSLCIGLSTSNVYGIMYAKRNWTNNFRDFVQKYADCVVFLNSMNDDTPTTNTVKLVVDNGFTKASNCRNFLQDGENSRSLKYYIKAGWPDTRNDGTISYQLQVEFWETMVKQGKVENFNVILDSAFDSPYPDKPADATLGWWKLVENSSYLNTSQYVFEDKQTIADREKKRSLNDLITQLEDPIYFERDFIFVHFTPYISSVYFERRTSLNVSLNADLISKLATRFSTVYVTLDDIIDSGNGTVLDEFAKYNLKASQLLEVIVLLDSVNPGGQEVGQEMISRANRVTPGTIKRVLIWLTGESQVHYIRSILNANSSSNVQVGFLLDMSHFHQFKTTIYGMPVQDLLGPVDFIHVSYLPIDTDNRHMFGVDRYVSLVTNRIQNVKTKLERIMPNLKVAFHTGYSDTFQKVKQDYTTLVFVWKAMNKWARETNTTLVMKSAFDAPTQHELPDKHSHMGWWMVSEQPGKETVLQEKKTVAIEKLRKLLESSEDSPLNISSIIIPVGTVMILFVLFIIVSFLIQRKKYKSKLINEKTNYLGLLDFKEDGNVVILLDTAFAPENSTLIGTGNFGMVYKCYMRRFNSEVAVKTLPINSNSNDMVEGSLKHSMALKSLLSEINIMSFVGYHENVLPILGVCPEHNLFMVTEYCKYGSLLSYLRLQNCNGTIPSNYELLQYCQEIASGMAFLEEKSVIHGDLAARNVLLNENKSVKISDFGLSRKLGQYETYMKKGEEPLPWRSMAFESLSRLEFSCKSDVWSMGVAFWEVFSLGKLPFPELAWNEEFCKKLEDGLRLAKPNLAEDNVFDVMISCWHLDSGCRPSPQNIRDRLQELKMDNYAAVM